MKEEGRAAGWEWGNVYLEREETEECEGFVAVIGG